MMVLSMLIDVIIPTFNRADVIERAIISVLEQTHQNFILHIVDDGSTDVTPTLLLKYQNHPRIKLYCQENLGVSSARNLAAKNAQSEWLSFLDSDDEWLPNKLELQVRHLNANPECVFLHSEELWIRNGVRVNPKQKHQKHGGDMFLRSLIFCLISPSTVIMSKKIFQEYGGFNEDYIVCEDYDLWIKILAHRRPDFISTPLTKKYGGHDDQLSTKFVAMDYWRIKSLVDLYRDQSLTPLQKNQIEKVISEKSALLLKNYIKYNNQKHFDEINALLATIINKEQP